MLPFRSNQTREYGRLWIIGAVGGANVGLLVFNADAYTSERSREPSNAFLGFQFVYIFGFIPVLDERKSVLRTRVCGRGIWPI